jgi:hypothetical protein
VHRVDLRVKGERAARVASRPLTRTSPRCEKWVRPGRTDLPGGVQLGLS